MTDLEQLSRDAAKVLKGSEVFPYQWINGPDGERTGALYKWRDVWLHESTEACAEIMVRVLWPAAVYVDGNPATNYAWCHSHNQHSILVDAHDADPMQAFRTAVLRALIEVKK